MPDLPQPERYSTRPRKRRLTLGLNTGAGVLLAALLVIMLNYLSHRHYVRSDWSASGYYRLSDKTKSLLQALSNRVDVVVFFPPAHELYEDIDNLLKEYEYEAGPMLRVERVDPNRDLARAEDLHRKYQVTEPNVVVFDQRGVSKFVSAGDIMDVDYSAMLQGGDPQRTAFKGEQAFSSALLAVTSGRKPVVYFLRGHGERDLENRDQYHGYSTLKREIERDHIEVRTFGFGEQQAVPADAEAVVVAGPKRRLGQAEIDLLGKYLAKDGRLLVLLDADTDTGLEPLLEEWGVDAGENVVVDPTRTLSGFELFVNSFAPHPVTRGLSGLTCVFYLPRTVTPRGEGAEGPDTSDKPRAVSLCASSADSWAEKDLDQKPMRFDKDRDAPGPVSLAAAVERGPLAGVDVDFRPSRMVVVGDADFVSNAPLAGGNYDFFMSALNWLLEREELLAIAAKAPAETRLIMDAAQLRLLFWAVVVGLPGLAGVAGLLVWSRRRK